MDSTKSAKSIQFEFILNDYRSPSNKKLIRRQVKRDVDRRRAIRSADALRLTEVPRFMISRDQRKKALGTVLRSLPTDVDRRELGLRPIGVENREPAGSLPNRHSEAELMNTPSILPEDSELSVANQHLGTEAILSEARLCESRSDKTIGNAHSPRIGLGSGCNDPFQTTAVRIDQTVVSYLSFFATSMWPAQMFKGDGSMFFRYVWLVSSQR